MDHYFVFDIICKQINPITVNRPVVTSRSNIDTLKDTSLEILYKIKNPEKPPSKIPMPPGTIEADTRNKITTPNTHSACVPFK